MKVSHILYKVNNLDEAVKKWREDGFVVEYGKDKNPYNALIYFSEGPYLELFENSGMPKFVKTILALFGKKKMVERIEEWETATDGLIAVSIENYDKDLNKELAILKESEHKYFFTKSRRLDTKGRDLRFSVAFPDELKIPFLMSYFNIDPKPTNFIHPNGVKEIKSISFGTDKDLMPLIHRLCDDPILKLYEGEGVKDLIFSRIDDL